MREATRTQHGAAGGASNAVEFAELVVQGSELVVRMSPLVSVSDGDATAAALRSAAGLGSPCGTRPWRRTSNW